MKVWFSCIIYMLLLSKAISQENNSLREASLVAQKALNDISRHIYLSTEQINNLKHQIKQIQNDKVELKENIKNIEKEHISAKIKLEKDKKLFKNYRIEQELAQQKYNKVKNQFLHIIGALEHMRLSPPPILIVNPQDIRKSMRGADILNIMIPKLQHSIYVYNDALKNLNSSIAEADKQKTQLISAIKNYDLITKKLNLLLHSANENEKISKQKINITQQDIAHMSTKTHELQKFLSIIGKQQNRKKIEDLEKKLNANVDFVKLKGKLELPVKGKIVQDFYLQKDSEKKGELLLATKDNKVVAPNDAIVAYAGNFRSYGNIVILNMGSNYYMILSGFSKLFVESNSFISKGKELGLVGSSKTIYVELKFVSESVNLQSWWI